MSGKAMSQRSRVTRIRIGPDAESLVVSLWLFDDQQRVVHSYVPAADAAALDTSNYRGGGATSLYDTWIDGLMANVAYAEQLRAGGTPCRSLAIIITDGEDTSSRKNAGQCARLTRDLLASERFTLAFVGVGNVVNFRRIASSMGLPDDCIAVDTQPTSESLERLLRQVSMAAVQLSMGTVQPGRGFF